MTGSALEAVRDVRAGTLSARERTLAAGERADRRAALGALWARDSQRELHAAADVDRRVAAGDDPGVLAGLTVAIKDCFDVAGLPTTAGLAGRGDPAPSDSALVALLRRAGAVPFGKAAMDQLAWTVSALAPGFPHCLNPVDLALSPGGSSSGSAVAVASGIVDAAIGTDVAGSTRIPAAWCGVVGYKPALGSLPLAGSVAFAPSFDLPGILARTVEDCQAIAKALGAAHGTVDGRRVRVGLLEDAFEQAHPEVATSCAEALASAVAPTGGGRVAPPVGFGRLLAVELHATWGARVDAEPERFTDAVRESIAFGGATSDADHRAAKDRIAAWRTEASEALGGYDVVCAPTTPGPAPGRDAVDLAEATRFTRPFNALGWPALSLPVGRDRIGRPIGLQLAGPPRAEALLFEVAAAVERALDRRRA